MENTILNEIILSKQKEVELLKTSVPMKMLLKKQRTRGHFSIKEFLSKIGASGIIAEFKRRSPSRGWINKEAEPAIVLPAYQEAGASAVSILTDHHFFGGSLSDLELAGEQIDLPVLRKDFIIDEYQIVEAAIAGADVILLIAANLSTGMVMQLANTAKQLQLEVLLEIHNQEELGHICEDVDLVGVNNRNLHTFKTELQTSVDLSTKIPDQFMKISESGIDHPDDIKFLKKHGYKGFLIGERFMKTNNPGGACGKFVKELGP